jgi:hypothetical protein
LQVPGVENVDDVQPNKLNCRCSPKKINQFVEVLSREVKEKIREMGFGGLLKLKANQLNRGSAIWLMDIFDLEKMMLEIGGGKKIIVDEFAVHCVFGLPCVGVDPPLVTDKIKKDGVDLRNELSKKLYGFVTKDITYAFLKDKIEKEFDDDVVLRCFFMVAFSNLLYPNTDFNIKIFDVVWIEDIGQISKINWCKAMVDDLRSCGKLYKVAKTKRLTKPVDFISFLFLAACYFYF